MRDEQIIISFLTSQYANSHLAVYLYILGTPSSHITSINTIMKIARPVFCPPFTEGYVITIVKKFLEGKKTQYLNGEFKLTPIY